MKVLLLNEGYSDNLGDQAINDSFKYLLKSNEIKNIDFVDFTKNINDPKKIAIHEKKNEKRTFATKLKKAIPPKIRWLLKNTYRVYKASKNRYDKVFIGGGQLILSNDTFAIAMATWIFFLKFFGNKDIVLFAVGSGSRFSFVDKLFYKYVLNNVSKIYVRDFKSQEIIKKLFNIDTKFVYDVAFIHNKITKNLESKKENILLGVISFDVYNRYNSKNLTKEEFFESWVELLTKNNIALNQVKLFYTTQDDRVASIEFKNYILNKYHIALELIETHTKDILVNELDKAKIVISARMHALILGLTYGCEIVTYKISDKLIAFDEMFGKDFELKAVQNNIEMTMKDVLNG